MGMMMSRRRADERKANLASHSHDVAKKETQEAHARDERKPEERTALSIAAGVHEPDPVAPPEPPVIEPEKKEADGADGHAKKQGSSTPRVRR